MKIKNNIFLLSFIVLLSACNNTQPPAQIVYHNYNFNESGSSQNISSENIQSQNSLNNNLKVSSPAQIKPVEIEEVEIGQQELTVAEQNDFKKSQLKIEGAEQIESEKTQATQEPVIGEADEEELKLSSPILLPYPTWSIYKVNVSPTCVMLISLSLDACAKVKELKNKLRPNKYFIIFLFLLLSKNLYHVLG